MNPRWTPERLDELRVLVADERKLSAAQIATMLHVKRSAVIGACYRNGIQLQGARSGRKPGPQRPRRSFKARTYKFKFEPVPDVPEDFRLFASAVVSKNLTLEELPADLCLYPYGEGPYFFCGHPQQENSSYCPAHHRLCWVKPTKFTGNASRFKRKAA